MIKSLLGKSLVLLALTVLLSACGGGGGGGSAPAAAPGGGGGGIGGGGVKGPLANAIVTIYLYDASQPGFKGAVAATGSTNAAAAITGLSLPFPVTPPYIMEISSDAGTTDITTGLAPVIGTLRTLITQALLDTGQQIYATPLTTMAVDIAIANSNAGTTAAQFQVALTTAATRVVSTLGFGMPAGIDIFNVPPLIDSTTVSTSQQANVAAYRTAIEAVTAVAYQMQQQSGGSSVDAVLSELSGDLADGMIDGVLNGTPSTIFTATTLNVLAQNPATLPIPNTNPVQTVADVQAILVSEKATTGNTTPTLELESGGSITTATAPAQINPDIDGDNVPNSEDAFPEDPLESVDTDGDGIGDNSDPDIDGNGILNEDEGTVLTPTATDTDGDGVDDAVDNCLFVANPTQTNSDGNALPDPGDACDTDDDDDGVIDTADAFPLDATESSDADADGTGDNADTDDDNDSIPDATEDASGISPDHDGDGIPNREDTDSDNDGALDGFDLDPYDDTVTFNNAPIAAFASVTVNEDASVAVTLTATDDGVPAAPLVYSIGTPSDGTLTGTPPNLTYLPDEDFNGNDSFTFSVTDGSGLVSNIATVSITVFPVNDAPVINASGPFGITESAADGTPVGVVTATDIDSSITGFNIESGNTGSAFAISPAGAITVADTTAIDFETLSSYTLTITATDGTASTAPLDVTISISNANDIAPVVTASGPFVVAASSANGTAVGGVSASDSDSAVTGYSITAGNTGNAFAIAANGQLSVLNNATLAANSPYTLIIIATDGINISTPGAVSITVNTDGAFWDQSNWDDGSTWQ